MIEIQDKVFHLKTEHYSYLLRINDWGQPEQLHFGAPVRTEDFSGFLCRPGLGWGASVLLDDKNSGSSPDDKTLEWSGNGRGDYRESPLEIGVSTDLRFAGVCVGKPAPMACGMPMAHGGKETLELTLRQEGLDLTLIYTPYETALTRRAVLQNRQFIDQRTVEKHICFLAEWEDIAILASPDTGPSLHRLRCTLAAELRIADNSSQHSRIGSRNAVMLIDIDLSQRADIDPELHIILDSAGQVRIQAVQSFHDDRLTAFD